MKPYFLLLLSVLFLTCKEVPDEPVVKANANAIVITGQYSPIDSIAFQEPLTYYYNNHLLKAKSGNFQMDSLERFSIAMTIEYPQEITLKLNHPITLLIEPGDSIHLQSNISELSKSNLLQNTNLSGTNTKRNEQLLDFQIKDSLANAFFRNFQSMTKQEMLDHHKDYYTKRNAFIDDYLTKNTIEDPLLSDWIGAERYLTPQKDLLLLEAYHNIFKANNTKSAGFEDSLFKGLYTLPKITAGMLSNKSVSSLGNYLITHYYKKANIAESSLDTKGKDSLLISRLMEDFESNPLVAQIAITDKISYYMESMEVGPIDSNWQLYQKVYKGSPLEKTIYNTYEDVRSILSASDLPDYIDDREYSFASARDFLSSLKNEFPNSVIYIDNWGTWCAPCRKQFEGPTALLKSNLKDKNITYVYLCHSSKKEAYLAMIKKYDLAGIHYFLTDEQGAALESVIQITGFPTYNIIDKTGELLYSGFEYRPSEKLTLETLSSLSEK